MAGITLRPLPRFMQFAREKISIALAFAVAAGPGITVPVPCTAHAAARFQYQRFKPKIVPQAMQLIKAREAGADNDGIKCRDNGRLLFGHFGL